MASKAFTLTAEPREKLGTRTSRRLRDAGKLPAVIYGHKETPVSLAVPTKAFNESLKKGAHLFELGFSGHVENVLLKDVQYDHMGTKIIHVDFARVDLNERVTVTVGIILKGDPIGEKEGGVLTQTLNEIEVECLVTEIPDAIVHMVADLKLDGSVHVSDLKVPQGVKLMVDGDAVVAVCHAIKEIELDGDAAANEPEVIKTEKPVAESEADKE